MGASSSSPSKPAKAGARSPAKVVSLPTPRLVRRRRALRVATGVAAIALVFMALAGLITPRIARIERQKADGAWQLAQAEQQILGLVNDQRVRKGEQPLHPTKRLDELARSHSRDMASRHYFSHMSPDGSTPAQRARNAGVPFHDIAENIYMDNKDDLGDFPDQAVRSWLHRMERRANILDSSFTRTGVGVSRSPDGRIYVTQEFAR